MVQSRRHRPGIAANKASFGPQLQRSQVNTRVEMAAVVPQSRNALLADSGLVLCTSSQSCKGGDMACVRGPLRAFCFMYNPEWQLFASSSRRRLPLFRSPTCTGFHEKGSDQAQDQAKNCHEE